MTLNTFGVSVWVTITATPTASHSPKRLGRVVWLDIARGGTILLVVSWHAFLAASVLGDVGNIVKNFNQDARPIRMPLFFFCSGMLAAELLMKQWSAVIKKRVLPVVWLILVWTLVQAIMNLKIHVYTWQYWDKFPDFFPFFWIPMGVLWFMYATLYLMIFARLIRSLPIFYQVFATVILTLAIRRMAPHISEELGQLGLLFRSLGDYAVFSFMAGVWLQKPIIGHFCNFRNAAAVLILSSCPLICLMAFKTKGYEILGFDIAVTALLIAMAISFARIIDEIPYVRSFLAWFGRRTLEIFVGHMLFISIVSQIFGQSNSNDIPFAYFVMVFLGIAGPLLLRWLSSKIHMEWMYIYPAHLFPRTGV